MRNDNRHIKPRTPTFAVATTVFAIAYVGLCLLSFRESMEVKRLRKAPLGNEFVNQKLSLSFLYSGSYFRMLGERLQYFPHDPRLVRKCLEKSVIAAPGNYENFRAYASHLATKKCCDEQLEYSVAEMVKRKRGHPETLLLAGELLLDAGMPQKALPYLNRSMKQGTALPSSVLVKVHKSGITYKQFIENRDQNDAISRDQLEPCKLALRMTHDLPKSGQIHRRDLLLGILTDYPDCAPAYVKVSETYGKEIETAVQYMEKAVSLEPETFSYSEDLARLYIRLSRFQDAERLLEKFLNVPDVSVDAYLALSACKKKQGKRDEAISILQTATVKNPDRASLWNELGKAYFQFGDFKNALKAFQEYASLVPQKPEAYVLLGDAYRELGELQAARQHYERALAIQQNNPRALRSLSQLDKVANR